MAEWAAKRFWTAAGIEGSPEGWAVVLDGKPVRSPGRQPLVLPTRPLAQAIAAEWDMQEGLVRPATMPMTKIANSAIDTVRPEGRAVRAQLAGFAETDLLSYRADGPEALVERQAALWDPLIEWAAGRHGGRLRITQGVMPVAQDPEALAALARPMDAMSPFELAGFHDMVTLTGSLILGLAAAEGVRSADEIWALSRLDELWQAEIWGRDEEAEAAAARAADTFRDSAAFHAMAAARPHD